MRVHDSQAYRKMAVTRERISRISHIFPQLQINLRLEKFHKMFMTFTTSVTNYLKNLETILSRTSIHN